MGGWRLGSIPSSGTIIALVAQQVEVLVLETRGFWFESRVGHQKKLSKSKKELDFEN